jgi:taurine dioxygenase
MQITPFDTPLGAEVTGLNAAEPQSAAAFARLREALAEHLVLLMRDQTLSDPALMAFSQGFGELDPPGPNPYGAPFLPEYPDINVISNVVEGGKPIGNLGAGEAVWHADMTYIDRPPKAAILYAIEVPEGQGDTWFANQFAAYEALPEDLRKAIDGKRLVHDGAHNSVGILRRGHVEPADPTETMGARHPLVRLDVDTGRRALFLGRRPHAYIEGLPLAESEALLDALWDHAAKPEFTWSHQWRSGDVLIWSNLGVLHRRDAFDPAVRRVMHRTQIKGDAAISA